MRQEHVAGDKAFLDYPGKRAAITDPKTGEIRKAAIFERVEKNPSWASNYTYAAGR